MNHSVLLLAATGLLSACGTPNTDMSTDRPVPPKANKVPHEMNAHGHTRNDEYFWMRLSEEQREAKAPDAHTQEVIAHLNAENLYADSLLAPVKELRETLFKEMKGRMKEEDLSVPYRENGYWYNHRFEQGKEYSVHMRGKATADGSQPEKLDDFINENTMAEGHDYFDLGDFEISPDNKLCAYSVDTVSRRLYTIRFRDLATGADLPDVITNTSGGGAFSDNRTFYYSRKDKTLRNFKI